MSNAHRERVDVKALRATSALKGNQSRPQVPFRSSNNTQLPSFRGQTHSGSATDTSNVSPRSGHESGNVSSTAESPPTMSFPSPGAVAQSELLQDSVFSTWKEESNTDSTDTPEELQKQDPLGTQIWKLYSRTKTRLPNQERMENLTWRMMAMNLKRREREQQQQAALYVYRLNSRFD